MKTIICDIDGTLANVDHRLHFIKEADKPDWEKFFDAMVDDTVNEWCLELIIAMAEQGHWIVYVTGRPDSHRIQTENWIGDYEAPRGVLYMRKAGDYRPDNEIKKEIYDEHLKDVDILFVLDDRQQVVDMWREQDLTVLQCAKGEF